VQDTLAGMCVDALKELGIIHSTYYFVSNVYWALAFYCKQESARIRTDLFFYFIGYVKRKSAFIGDKNVKVWVIYLNVEKDLTDA